MSIRKTLEHKAQGDRERLLLNFNKALDKLEGTYRNLTIIIADEYPLATLSQRAYLHGAVLKIIEKETGTDSVELFEIFKNQFGDPMHVEQIDVGQYRLSTKMYNTKTMAQFTEKIRVWAQEHNLYIPLPNEVPDSEYLKLIL
jgi:hypothetical protein